MASRTSLTHKTIADAKGMLITGFGYKLTRVVVVENAGPAETTLWEGDPVDINWGDANVLISPEQMAEVPVGATVSLTYEIIDADYHALRITNNDWTADIVPQIDGFENQPNQSTRLLLMRRVCSLLDSATSLQR